MNNPINIISFYQECKQAISFHLSIYPVETFVHLAILQYIKEGGNPMAFSIQRLKLYLPQFLKVDETIEQIGSDIIKNYYNLTPPSAGREFIELCIRNGAQFCFVERVKFRGLNNKWRISSTRWLYVSSLFISISKDYGQYFYLHYPLSSIENISIENDHIIILFNDEQKWMLKTSNIQILFAAIKDLTSLSKDTNKFSHIEISNKNSSRDELSDECKSSNCTTDDFIPTELSSLNSKRNLNQKGYIDVQPGISKLVCPKEDEIDQEYSITEETTKELKITKQLIIPTSKINPSNILDFDWCSYSSKMFYFIENNYKYFVIIFLITFLYVFFG